MYIYIFSISIFHPHYIRMVNHTENVFSECAYFVFLKTFRLSRFHFLEPQFWSHFTLSIIIYKYIVTFNLIAIYTAIFFFRIGWEPFSFLMLVYVYVCIGFSMPLKIGKYLQTLEMLSIQFNTFYRFCVFFLELSFIRITISSSSPNLSVPFSPSLYPSFSRVNRFQWLGICQKAV